MSDFPVFDLGFMSGRNKDPAYRNRCRLRFLALHQFFLRNALYLQPRAPFDATALTGLEKIMWSDLSDLGKAVVKSALDKWLRGQDRGNSPDDMTILNRALSAAR